MEPIRVLLADDHALMRAALRVLIDAEPDMTVVGEAENGEEAVRLAELLKPDVVVMDITMRGTDGLTATAAITLRLPRTKVLALTMHEDERHLLQFLAAGGSGYVLKRATEADLLGAIRTVQGGEVSLPPWAVQCLLSAYRHGDHPQHRTAETLSAREEDVLRLTVQGYSNTEIGEQLYLSSKTVDTYRQRIMEKLGLHRRAELVRYALDVGLLTIDAQA